MRLLKSVLACLRKSGQRPSQVGKEPRLNWRGTPGVQGYQATSARSQFDTLFSTRPRRSGQVPKHSEKSKA
jgi:hypothetical protein